MSSIVARVRPRASEGITDLLLLSFSYGFRAVNLSKKNLYHTTRNSGREPTDLECQRHPPANDPTKPPERPRMHDTENAQDTP